MASHLEKCRAELLKLLEILRDSWSTEGSATTVPPTLSNLLSKVIASSSPSTTTTPTQRPLDTDAQQSDGGIDANDVAQLSALSDIASLVLAGDGARARSRAYALDCLRLGLLLLGNVGRIEGGVRRDVFAIAAAGARDERWNVRMAAARVAGEGLRKCTEEEMLNFLSSKQGSWLPALLIDGYPEVEEAARAALSSAPLHTPGSDNPAACNGSTSRSSSRSVVAIASAVLRGACGVLRRTAAIPPCEKVGGVGDGTVVDLDAEATTRTALRALQGGVSLLGSPGLDVGFPPSSTLEATELRMEALEAVEAWLATTLTDPQSSLPWVEKEGQGAVGAADAVGGGLSAEARDAVRTLVVSGTGGVLVAAVEAAVGVVDEFRAGCCRLVAEGERLGGEKEEEEEEDFWRTVCCGLLVRLEVFFAAAAEPEAPAGLSARIEMVEGKEEREASSLQTPVGAQRSSVGFSRRRSDDGVAEHTASDNGSEYPIDGKPSAASLARKLAEALEEVPFAHEQAIPSNIDHDDAKFSASEKKALRIRGDRRRRWMVSSVQLLLRAAAKFCERHRTHPMAADGSGAKEEVDATMVGLLVAVLPFQQGSTKADEPIEVWLSCMRRDGLKHATLLPAPQPPPGASIPVSAATTTTTTITTTTTTTTATTATALTTPVPWESCVKGQALPRQELFAPWAANPATVDLAARCVGAAWAALSLDGDGPVAERSAEALVQALRACVRRRRGWREDAGVGVKHATSAAIRRLRFPLLSGATLGHALPLALPLADDYDSAHQAVGFSLLLHLFAEATATELAWHRGLLLEVLERALGCGSRDPSACLLCLAAVVELLRRAPRGDAGVVGRAGIRIARQALAEAGRTSDGVVRVVMVCGAAALLELPATREGYAPCEVLRPALLCLLPILQFSPGSPRIDARAATLRALHTLCLSCWPRLHAHSSKLLCALLWACADCSRRASARELADDGAASVGAAIACSAIDASADESVREHATRLGALILVLTGDPARSTLQEVCAAVSVVRPVGCAMEKLADRPLEGLESAGE